MAVFDWWYRQTESCKIFFDIFETSILIYSGKAENYFLEEIKAELRPNIVGLSWFELMKISFWFITGWLEDLIEKLLELRKLSGLLNSWTN